MKIGTVHRHRVQLGETLYDLSELYYDDPNYVGYIWQHNRLQIENPNQLTWGQEIVIPHLPHTWEKW